MSFRPPFLVKVCGLTSEVDVDLAVSAGADAVGVVSYSPSIRHVTDEHAAALLARRTEGVQGVLVVVDAMRDELEQRVRAVGADLVQLCGNESPEDFVNFPVPILRRVPVDSRALEEMRAWRRVPATFLLDHPASPGGSGRGVDLALARDLCAAEPCVLAGGLEAEVVADRVAATGASAVDASSRLESSPGVKDPEAVRAFVRGARRALGMEIKEATK